MTTILTHAICLITILRSTNVHNSTLIMIQVLKNIQRPSWNRNIFHDSNKY